MNCGLQWARTSSILWYFNLYYYLMNMILLIGYFYIDFSVFKRQLRSILFNTENTRVRPD